MSTPQSLSFLLPYLRIAVDHDNRDSVVSYYVRMYCVKRGMENSQGEEPRQFLASILSQLESEKIKLVNNDIIGNEEAALQHISQYAVQLFLKADDIDRSGQSDRTTARLFMTAAFLFDVCEMLADGALDDELTSIRKMAKIKSAQIYNLLKKPNVQPVDIEPQIEMNTQHDHPDRVEAVQQAQKLCKFTISALQHDDVQTAVEYLTKSLEILLVFSKKQ
ncbi:hypothetical protein ACOME3_005564 [Neoechinorhynchus agilis]